MLFPEKENHTYQSPNYRFLYKGKLLNYKFYRPGSFNCIRNNQSLENLTVSSIKTKDTSKYEQRSLCLIIGVLALLSIGMCIQADSFAQSLREVARTSIKQAIRMK
ncbi:hypothetical protein [Calothrix sp. PCC 6303]|uniref:hypothetical protein n=1 Tax=Calothrix sp. PCC 6303 TaxID=1170562 RepID=UPI0002A039CC|nr:hypothetical protein [Calothrix sp. PCC 6303]AFZ01154.1 hypothetical protein Cal6303_2130 [Calothrix sp. PCC 6303]